MKIFPALTRRRAIGRNDSSPIAFQWDMRVQTRPRNERVGLNNSFATSNRRSTSFSREASRPPAGSVRLFLFLFLHRYASFET